MSTIRKNSFFRSLRACTPTPSFLHHRLQWVWSASSTILRHFACRWIQKWRVDTRVRRLNRIPTIRVRSDLVVVENDISNRCFVLIPNKRRVKILEILWDFRSDSVISENVGNIKQVQALINEFNFDKLCFRRKWRYARKDFIIPLGTFSILH